MQPCVFAERIGALAGQEGCNRAVFQSVAGAVLKTLETVRGHEQAVAEAAFTLAQRERFAAMTATLEETAAALREMLCTQALDHHEHPATPKAAETRWWFVLSEALQALDDAINQVSAMVAGQPRKSAARTLGGIVVQLLHRHYNVFLAEAEQWMT